MKLLVDMNLSPEWIGYLALAGFEAAHWSRFGSPSAADRDIMAFAREHDYVLLTHDLDFSAMLSAVRGEKPSVVQIRAGDLHVSSIGDSLVHALTQMSAELNRGALLTIEPGRTRIRLLPLQRK
jgi:predicted nuclease of predicted toxin-antitoxin system